MISTQPQDLRITIITVVRNGAAHIRHTIESVLGQTYPNIEYIIIDGLSTDGTVDIIRGYESRSAHWKSEPDEGIGDAFNKGLELATGDYIQYLNADDLLAGKDVVSQVVNLIHKHNQPALIYGDIGLISQQSHEIIQRLIMQFTASALLQGRALPHPALFAHKSYFAKYGNFDNSFRIAMDYDWLLRGALQERVVHIPVLVSLFRYGGISTVNAVLSRDEVIAALKKNRFITTRAQELRLRTYFYLRRLAKSFLQMCSTRRLTGN